MMSVLRTAHPREEAFGEVVRNTVGTAISFSVIDKVVLMLLAEAGVGDVLVCKDYGARFHILVHKLRDVAHVLGVTRSHDDARSPSTCIVATARKDIACGKCLHKSDDNTFVLCSANVVWGVSIDRSTSNACSCGGSAMFAEHTTFVRLNPSHRFAKYAAKMGSIDVNQSSQRASICVVAYGFPNFHQVLLRGFFVDTERSS